MNSIQRYLKLPFIERKAIEETHKIYKDENLSIETNNLLNIIREENKMEDQENVFNLYSYQTKIYFLKFSDFYNTIYSNKIDDRYEESLNLYIIKNLRFESADHLESFFIEASKLSLASDTEHILTQDYDQNDKETKIFISYDENKIYFLNINKKQNKCFRLIVMDLEKEQAIEYMKLRYNIWDNGLLDLFKKFEIFGSANYLKNLDYLKILYEKLGVNDTITL